MKNQESKLINRALAAKTKRVLILALVCSALALGMTSCKAWRTISTTATYTQQNDSTTGKASATITTKTVEEYQGVKKN